MRKWTDSVIDDDDYLNYINYANHGQYIEDLTEI